MHGLLLFTALLTMALLVYGLYQLNQRVMRLEAKKRQIASEKAAKASASAPPQANKSVDIFHDLEGEELFYAMTGDVHQELEFSEDARKRFELVIRKHLLEVLEKAKNGERSLDSETMIRTLRGPVRSWLPQDVVSSLLIQGGLLATDPKDEGAMASIRSTIDRLYLQLGYQSPDDVLGLADQTADSPEESADEPKRPPGADGFM
ncbi:MAG: hypothetical protein L7U49_02840 [Litoricolaceae bacterium]|jgi:hypothetical protein|nr:hypothetical protein [Litorivicinaceae bacterium]